MSDTIVVYVDATPEVIEVSGITGPQGPAGTGLDTLTTKGDTLGHNGTAAVRVPVGSNGQVLTADSTATPGVKWATPASSAAWADITNKPTFTDLATANSTDEDVEITDATKGVILRNANGERGRITLTNNRTLGVTILPLILALAMPAMGQTVESLMTDTNGNVISGRSAATTLTFSNAIHAFSATTNISAVSNVVLNASRSLLVNLNISGAWGTNTIMLPTNSPQHGDVATLRFRQGVGTNPVIVTNAGGLGGPWYLFVGNEARWIYDTNTFPNRWSALGRTVRPELMFGALATNDHLPAGTQLLGETNATVRVATIGTNGALGASSGVPSGAAASNSILRADGAGGSAFVADGVFLARQLTNGPVVTNGAATTSLTISNIPAGLYWVQGQLNSTTTTARLFQLTATHQVLGPRNLLGWFDSGSASGFFNATTNMHNNSDGASGTRNGAITGPLLFTNTATVSFFVSVTGATNTAQILSNSFLFLRKLD